MSIDSRPTTMNDPALYLGQQDVPGPNGEPPKRLHAYRVHGESYVSYSALPPGPHLDAQVTVGELAGLREVEEAARVMLSTADRFGAFVSVGVEEADRLQAALEAGGACTMEPHALSPQTRTESEKAIRDRVCDWVLCLDPAGCLRLRNAIVSIMGLEAYRPGLFLDVPTDKLVEAALRAGMPADQASEDAER